METVDLRDERSSDARERLARHLEDATRRGHAYLARLAAQKMRELDETTLDVPPLPFAPRQ